MKYLSMVGIKSNLVGVVMDYSFFEIVIKKMERSDSIQK